MKKAFAMFVYRHCLESVAAEQIRHQKPEKFRLVRQGQLKPINMGQFMLMKVKQHPKKPGKIQRNPVRRMRKVRF